MRISPAQLRLRTDLQEVECPPNVEMSFPDPNNIMKFEVLFDLKDYDCLWKGGRYKITFDIPNEFPYHAPRCVCEPSIYHPNIDNLGKVCLQMLGLDWRPMMSINAVIYALYLLFDDPNPEDPKNQTVAKVMRDNPAQFRENVQRSLRGGVIDGV